MVGGDLIGGLVMYMQQHIVSKLFQNLNVMITLKKQSNGLHKTIIFLTSHFIWHYQYKQWLEIKNMMELSNRVLKNYCQVKGKMEVGTRDQFFNFPYLQICNPGMIQIDGGKMQEIKIEYLRHHPVLKHYMNFKEVSKFQSN